MAQFNLNRAQDTPIATLKLNEITPKNWHRFPPPVDDMTRENAVEEAAPHYHGAEVATDWVQGDPIEGADAGNDGETGTATRPVEDGPRGQPWDTQADKAAALGTTMAVDITKSYAATERGDVEAGVPLDDDYQSTPIELLPAHLAALVPEVTP